MTAKLLSALIAATAVLCAQPTSAEIDALYPEIEALYMDLHRNPELGFKEVRTAATLAARMQALGFEVTTGVGGTGVVALLRNGDGPTVMLRTEMDALPVQENTGLPFASRTPGVMHACGHDLHMAAWTGAATWMARRRGAWSGTLMMVGQLAEEGSGGARAMLADGLFTRFPKPDFALSLHDDDTLPAGRVGYHPGFFRAGSDRVRITIHGRGGHAAAPHKTVDPVVIAGHVVVRLQTIVSRESNPVEPVVVTIGSIHGGTRENIIPAEVALELSVRTYSPESRDRVLSAIDRIARAEAMAANAPKPPELDVRQNAPPVYNDPELTARLASALKKSLGEANVVEMPAKMTSEDFAEYGRAGVRSALLHIGAVDAAKLEAAAKSGVPVPAPHSAEWAPEREPTLKNAIRAEVTELLELLGKRP